ncbi:MAG TPA: hypothetical protein PKM39_06425, partial [Pseudothauera hydrothermalis]|nr:hypothetical protein [Pseudothauera hydrothermalis]
MLQSLREALADAVEAIYTSDQARCGCACLSACLAAERGRSVRWATIGTASPTRVNLVEHPAVGEVLLLRRLPA